MSWLDLPLFLKWFAGVLCVGSVFVWALASIRLWHRLPILERETDRPRDVHWLSVILSVTWILQGVHSFVLKPVQSLEKLDPKKVLEGAESMLIVEAILLPFCWLPMLLNRAAPARDLGFHLRDPGGQISDGILGFLAAVLPVVLVLLATNELRATESQHPMLQLLSHDNSAQTLILIVVLTVIAAPLFEELLYRVVLQTVLEKLMPARFSLTAVAVIFSLTHKLPDAIPLLPLALILGYVYQQRRSYLTVVLIHVLFNATNLLFMVLIRDLT